VKDIATSGYHLLSIINDILDLAKAEANKLTLEEREIDLVQVVSESIRMCEPRAATKWNQDRAQILRRSGDRARRRQADPADPAHLVSNAVKFSHNGRLVEVSLNVSDRSVLMRVRDEGIGIPAPDVERVLRPFEQVENSPHPPAQRHGAGPSYAVKLAELHGGTLWIESQVNIGTTVTVALPRDRFIAVRQVPENLRVAI